MRYIVIGLGAIGGVLAARLHQAGREVIGIARGEHLAAIARDGLLLRDPDGDDRVRLDVRPAIADVERREDDVVVLATKSQDTHGLLRELVASVPATTPVLCAQNGVANEPDALRWFDNVYGVVVMCPALHLEPGVVVAYSSPTPGILDLGRYPAGEDDLSKHAAADFEAAGFVADSIPDISRWKYTKLLMNLGNAVEAVCGPDNRNGALTAALRAEARSLLELTAVDYASDAEDKQRRGSILQFGDVDGPRPGSSLWQSVSRGTGTTEVDYLNGEIVRLARLTGAAAPANALMQHLTREVAAGRIPVAGFTESEVLEMIGSARPAT